MLYIPHNFPSFNDINRINKSGKTGYANKIKQEYTNIARIYFLKAKKIDKYPIKVSFTWYSKTKARDLDGFGFAKKCVLDGMVKSGFIKNDNLNCINFIEDKAVISDKIGVIIEWREN